MHCSFCGVLCLFLSLFVCLFVCLVCYKHPKKNRDFLPQRLGLNFFPSLFCGGKNSTQKKSKFGYPSIKQKPPPFMGKIWGVSGICHKEEKIGLFLTWER